MVTACNPTQEVEAGGLQIQSQTNNNMTVVQML